MRKRLLKYQMMTTGNFDNYTSDLDYSMKVDVKLRKGGMEDCCRSLFEIDGLGS